MKENWKKIEGFDQYEVSDQGRVKSLARKRESSNYFTKEKFEYRFFEKILKPIVTGIGYTAVNLYREGRLVKQEHIHRLVAKAFIPNTENKPQVNHIDGVRSNNNVSNLEWVTPSENMLHSFRVLGNSNGFLGKFGKDHKTSKAVIQKTLEGRVVKKWDSGMDAVRSGYDSSSITRCCQGKYKQHKGYKWEYAK